MSHIKMSFCTPTPMEYVFDYITEPDNMPAWNRNLLAIKNQSEGPVAAGTSWIQVFKLYGRTTELPCRVLEYERPLRIVCEMMLPLGVRLLFSLVLEPQGDGTKVTYIADYEPPSSLRGKIAARVIESRVRRDTERSVDNLKAILQNGAMTKR